MLPQLTNDNLLSVLPTINIEGLEPEDLIKLSSIVETGIKYWEGKNINYKVRINALYGILSEIHCRYYELLNAESITATGQLCVRGVRNYINRMGKGRHTVIYSDTDSNFIILSEEECLKVPTEQKERTEYLVKYFAREIAPRIKEYFDKLAKTFNFMGNYIEMEVELIGDKGIMLEKKSYVIRKIWNKGIFILPEQRKYKIIGVDIVRRDFPQWTRDRLKKALDIIFENDNEELIKFIDEAKKDFYKLGIDEISKPTSVQNITDYYIGKKGCPRHTGSALYYNKFLEDNGLEKKYEKIYDASKVKYLYIKGKLAESQNYDSIAFVNECPPELRETFEINYDKMWEKIFIKPLERIVIANGWNMYPVNNFLEELF